MAMTACLKGAHRLTWMGLVLLLVVFAGGSPNARESTCSQPAAVCQARAAVFRIAGFDPLGSAVRISETELVTARHVVADHKIVDLFLDDGSKISADVVPTAYGGDLILLKSNGLPAGPVLSPAEVRQGDLLYAIGADMASGTVRAYAPGPVLLMPAAGKPLARLHHAAFNQPGNSGGALVDGHGNWVGLLVAGGEGRFEAIPATEIAVLVQESGEGFSAASQQTGAAVRRCVIGLEKPLAPRDIMPVPAARDLEIACLGTGNRQLYDLAAQRFGQHGDPERAIKLFQLSLDQDPNALNSRLGLVITLHYLRRYADEVPHLRVLLADLPENIQVLWFAVQAGARSGERDLAQTAVIRLQRLNPDMAAAAARLLESVAPAKSQ
ncbi:MAG: trypsin-like peptidase domain-containing protein [Rhodospirillales bacterium]|nr:trypsin-like peptidase domain-containing protein [Rhodospirillales bacterium]